MLDHVTLLEFFQGFSSHLDPCNHPQKPAGSGLWPLLSLLLLPVLLVAQPQPADLLVVRRICWTNLLQDLCTYCFLACNAFPQVSWLLFSLPLEFCSEVILPKRTFLTTPSKLVLAPCHSVPFTLFIFLYSICHLLKIWAFDCPDSPTRIQAPRGQRFLFCSLL